MDKKQGLGQSCREEQDFSPHSVRTINIITQLKPCSFCGDHNRLAG